MATRVKTDAETDIPCTKPLILHTVLEKGQPVEQVTIIRILSLILSGGKIVSPRGFFEIDIHSKIPEPLTELL